MFGESSNGPLFGQAQAFPFSPFFPPLTLNDQIQPFHGSRSPHPSGPLGSFTLRTETGQTARRDF